MNIGIVQLNEPAMKKIIQITLLLLICFTAKAQNDVSNTKNYRVAVFASLYLDSVFNDGQFRYEKNFPRFVVPGIDFLQGAQVALDSMPDPAAPLTIQFFDAKSETETVSSLIEQNKLDSFNLIIGAVKDDEYPALAYFAQQKKIPFISATYPNDGGISANPYLVILNSTLKAHCEAIYSYILQNHGTDRIFLVRKPGGQEDKVAGYFNSLNKPDGKPLLNIQTINIDSTFGIVKAKLDSNSRNIIIGGSLDEDFAYSLASVLAPVKKKYDITLIGMPNWDGFQSFNGAKKNLNDFPVYYTSPYFNNKTDNYSKMVQNLYLDKYKGKPSDFAYKGFETMYVFARLLARYPDDYMSHLNDYAFKIFSEYNFKPVYLKKGNTTPDYYENKHLYFLKSVNGNVSRAW